MSARRVLIIATPMAAFAVLAVGLRVGASSVERAAMVYASPPPKSRAGLAWQIVTLEYDRGMKQPVSAPRLAVTARWNGKEAVWEGSSNTDGVAEAWLALDGVAAGDPIELTIRDAKTGALLGAGRAAGPPREEPYERVPWFATHTHKTGDIALDVAVYGRKLAPGFPVPIWIRATDADGRALRGVTIGAVADGMKLSSKELRTDDRGWATVTGTAISHVVGLDLKADAEQRHGEWGATLEVAPGASAAGIPLRVVPGAAATFEVIGVTSHPEYVEIRDGEGRVVGEALTLLGDSAPRATFDVPKLRPGLYWVVTSNTPSSMEGLAPSTIARPFAVAESDEAALKMGPYPAACVPPSDPAAMARALGACLSVASPPPIPRWLALDGFVGKRARDARARARGAAIAVGALVVAAALEALLIVAGAVEASRKLRRLDEEGESAAARLPLLNVAIGLLVAMLGFALVAAFVLREG